MPGHAAQIVGREHELETIDRLLKALPTGAFLVVVGEAGIGKTRLLEALRENADDRGLLVAEGRGWEFERDYPFGVLVDALDEYLESLDAREVERAAGDVTTELAAVFPALRTLGGGGGLVATERYRAHEAVGLLLERLAGGRGLLLVLDDVHWADDATIELVTHLLRRRPAARVVIALAYRPRQIAPRLAAALEQAGRRGIVERIELSPLSESEAAALLPPTTDPEAARRLYEVSGGNPYYLEQLTRGSDGVPGPVAAAGEPAGLAVPAAVSAALAHELFMVGDAARELLEAAAVVGEPFELDVAAEVAPLELPVALEALDELVERDLLRGTEVPRRFRFRHPIVLRAVYEASRPGWRLAAHERAARALAARGQTALALARHVAHSATIGDEDAIALLTDAAETAAPRAPAAAAHWFESALTLVPPEDAPRRSVLLTRLAFNRAVTGALDEARAAMIEALEALPDDAVESRIKTISFCAAIEHLLGRHQEAHDRLTSAMGAIPERDSPAAAAIAIELAADGLLHLDFEQMRTWADRGIVLTEEVGEPLLTAAATGVLALAELHDGRSEDAGRRSDDACTLVDGLSDERVSERLEGVYYLAAVEYLLERDDDAIRHLERGIAISRQTGQDFLITTMTALLALAAKRRGRIRDAVALSRDAAEGGRLSGNRQALAQALTAHCWALLAAGDVRAASP